MRLSDPVLRKRIFQALLDGKSNAQIGAELSLSRQRIGQIRLEMIAILSDKNRRFRTPEPVRNLSTPPLA